MAKRHILFFLGLPLLILSVTILFWSAIERGFVEWTLQEYCKTQFAYQFHYESLTKDGEGYTLRNVKFIPLDSGSLAEVEAGEAHLQIQFDLETRKLLCKISLDEVVWQEGEIRPTLQQLFSSKKIKSFLFVHPEVALEGRGAAGVLSLHSSDRVEITWQGEGVHFHLSGKGEDYKADLQADSAKLTLLNSLFSSPLQVQEGVATGSFHFSPALIEGQLTGEKVLFKTPFGDLFVPTIAMEANGNKWKMDLGGDLDMALVCEWVDGQISLQGKGTYLQNTPLFIQGEVKEEGALSGFLDWGGSRVQFVADANTPLQLFAPDWHLNRDFFGWHLTGAIRWQGTLERGLLAIEATPHLLIAEKAPFRLTLNEKSRIVLGKNFQAELDDVKLVYLPKQLEMQINDFDLSGALPDLQCNHFSLQLGEIFAEGKGAFSMEKESQYHGEITLLEGQWSDFLALFAQLDIHHPLLTPYLSGEIVLHEGKKSYFSEKGIQLYALFSEGEARIKNNFTIDDIHFLFTLDTAANELQIHELEGSLIVGRDVDKMEEYQIHGDKLFFTHLQKLEGQFDLWAEQSSHDILRIVGTTVHEGDELTVLIDRALSHVGPMHFKKASLALTNESHLHSLYLETEGELQSLTEGIAPLIHELFFDTPMTAFPLEGGESSFSLSYQDPIWDFSLVGKEVIFAETPINHFELRGSFEKDLWKIDELKLDDINVTLELKAFQGSYQIVFFGFQSGKSTFLGLDGWYYPIEKKLVSQLSLVELQLDELSHIPLLGSWVQPLQLRGTLKGREGRLTIADAGDHPQIDFEIITLLSAATIQQMTIQEIEGMHLHYRSGDFLLLTNAKPVGTGGDIQLGLEKLLIDFSQDELLLSQLQFSIQPKAFAKVVKTIPTNRRELLSPLLKDFAVVDPFKGQIDLTMNAKESALKMYIEPGNYSLFGVLLPVQEIKLLKEGEKTELSLDFTLKEQLWQFYTRFSDDSPLQGRATLHAEAETSIEMDWKQQLGGIDLTSIRGTRNGDQFLCKNCHLTSGDKWKFSLSDLTADHLSLFAPTWTLEKLQVQEAYGTIGDLSTLRGEGTFQFQAESSFAKLFYPAGGHLQFTLQGEQLLFTKLDDAHDKTHLFSFKLHEGRAHSVGWNGVLDLSLDVSSKNGLLKQVENHQIAIIGPLDKPQIIYDP